MQVRATNDEGTGDWSDAGSGATDANAAPTIAGVAVTSTPDLEDDTYGEDETIEVSVTFNEAVNATANTDFVLSVAGAKRAPLLRGSNSATLVFGYTVEPGDEDDDGIWIGDQGRTLVGDREGNPQNGAITSVATGTAANLTHSELGQQSGHKVDGGRRASASPVFEEGDSTTRTVARSSLSSSSGAVVGDPVLATDDDDDELFYKLGGADKDLFVIIRNAGQIRTWPAAAVLNVDYSLRDAYEVTVEVRDRSGEEDADDAIAVTIEFTGTDDGPPGDDANAAPSFSSDATFDAAENRTSAGTVVATDSDADDDVTGYAIAGGADRSFFSIGATSGALTFDAAPNYEDAQDIVSVDPANAAGNNQYVVVVRATSGTGAREMATEQTVVVTVTDDDTEAPGKPAAPAVTAASATSLTVNWSAPDNAGPAITDYDYRYRTTSPQENWTEVTNTTITGLSATIGSLSETTSYDVQVRATNDEGTGDWSLSGAGATRDKQVMAPGQVTGVSVTNQVEQLMVSWNEVAGASGYKVQWKSGGQNYNEGARQYIVSSGATTEHTISNLTAGVEYTVRVIATKNNAADGPASAEATGTPLASPPPPSTTAQAPENLQAATGNSQVTLSWDAPNDDGGADVTGYAWRHKESGGDFTAYTDITDSGPGEANARSYTVTGLMNEQEYVFQVRAVNEHGGGLPAEVTVMLPTVISTESEELPAEVTLSANYPNPFNPETTIRYGLPKAGQVRLAVYDMLGHEVAVLVDRSKPAGNHTVRFGAGDLPSGVYAYRLQAGGETVARTMMLLK